MGLILALIGGIAGWNVGELHWGYFAIVAGVALIPAVLEAALLGGSVDLIDVAAVWTAAFLYLAIPFAALAWLKRKRIENRADE